MSDHINRIIPVLPVTDVNQTQEYYRDVLDFNIDWIWEDTFGSVSRDGIVVYFSKEAEPRTGAVCCILVDEVDGLCESLRETGAKIVAQPETKPWQVREFTVEDNNGHQFRVYMNS